MTGLHEWQHLVLCSVRKRRKISGGKLTAFGFVAARPIGERAVILDWKRDAVRALLAG